MKYHFLYLFLLFANVACGQVQPQENLKDTLIRQPTTTNNTNEGTLSESKLLELGKKYVEFGSYSKAIETYSKIIRISPDYLDAYLERASCYRKMSYFSKAIADIELVLKKDVGNPLAYNDLGVVFFSRGDSKVTIKYCTLAIKSSPNYGRAYYNRGGAYYDLKQLDKACADWKKAWELGDDDAKAKLDKNCKK